MLLKHRRVSSCIVTALANVNSSFFARRQAGQSNTLALACTVDNLDMSSTPRVMPSSRAATAAQPKTEGFASKSPVIKVVTHGSVQASAPTQHLREAFTRLPPCPSSQRLDETLTTIRKFLELRSKYMSATPAESSKAAKQLLTSTSCVVRGLHRGLPTFSRETLSCSRTCSRLIRQRLSSWHKSGPMHTAFCRLVLLCKYLVYACQRAGYRHVLQSRSVKMGYLHALQLQSSLQSSLQSHAQLCPGVLIPLQMSL